MNQIVQKKLVAMQIEISMRLSDFKRSRFFRALSDDRGDVPGWVLVVLMTTGLVTAIWTIAAPRLTAILKNSLDAIAINVPPNEVADGAAWIDGYRGGACGGISCFGVRGCGAAGHDLAGCQVPF